MSPDEHRLAATLRALADRLERDLEELQAELDRRAALALELHDRSPDGLVVLHPDGRAETSPAADRMLGIGTAGDPAEARPDAVPSNAWRTEWGFFGMDGARIPAEQLPGVRALAGERVGPETILLRSPDRPDPIVVEVTARPLPDGSSLSVLRDASEEHAQRRALEADDTRIAVDDLDRELLAERLHAAALELASPVIAAGDRTLIVPVVAAWDDDRAALVRARVLDEVARRAPLRVAIDLSSAHDLAIAPRLLADLARGIVQLGARCALTGAPRTLAEAWAAGPHAGLAEIHAHVEDLLFAEGSEWASR